MVLCQKEPQRAGKEAEKDNQETKGLGHYPCEKHTGRF